MLKNIHDKPIIGICLGMQLLFQHSAEGDVSGLNLSGKYSANPIISSYSSFGLE